MNRPVSGSRPAQELPEWALLALADVRGEVMCNLPNSQWPDKMAASRWHDALGAQLSKRWREIKVKVLPELGRISDEGKTHFLYVVLMTVEATAPDNGGGLAMMRSARDDADDERQKICRQSEKLIELITKAKKKNDRYGSIGGIPNLWDCLEAAARKYPDWRSGCAQGGVSLDTFLSVADGQTRPAPNLEDILQEFCNQLAEAPPTEYPRYFAGALNASRQSKGKGQPKSSADKKRLLTDAISRLQKQRHLFPENFRLSGEALATLADVIFGWDPGKDFS